MKAQSLAWISLCFAILIEVAWVLGLRYTEGLTKFPSTIIVLFIYLLGLFPLGFAIKSIPPFVAYSVWVGVAIVLITLIDTYYFKEALGILKAICIALILCGTLGLKLLSD